MYACTAEEVEEACGSFLRCEVTATGWDLEWRTLFRAKEPPRKTALMQICYQAENGAYFCLLLHIFYSGLTPSVQSFLQNPVETHHQQSLLTMKQNIMSSIDPPLNNHCSG